MKIINAFNSQLELFSEEGYADFSGNSIRSIRNERSAGRGPAFVKLGKTTARRLLCRAVVLCGRKWCGCRRTRTAARACGSSDCGATCERSSHCCETRPAFARRVFSSRLAAVTARRSPSMMGPWIILMTSNNCALTSSTYSHRARSATSGLPNLRSSRLILRGRMQRSKGPFTELASRGRR